MKTLKNAFLFRLYREFKLLFGIALVFLFGTLWFALKSHEEFPFLLFGMYSLKEETHEEYLAYSIVVDGEEIVYRNMNDAQHELVATSLSNTVAVNIPLSNTGFINWLKRYSSGNKPMEIYKLTCLYTQEGQPLVRKRELIYPHDEL